MRVTNEVKALCVAEMTRCHAVAEAHFDRTFVLPTMIYTKRGATAGTYHKTKHLININPVLLMENVTEMVENTVSHEYAHAVDQEVHGNQTSGRNWRTGRSKRIIHGPTFKAIQRLFGRSDSTTHSMDTSSVKISRPTTKVHVWTCGCGGGSVTLTPMKHKRMLAIAHTGFGVYRRGHTANRCGNYTYTGLADAAPVAIAAKKPAAPKRQKKVTKLDLCRAAFNRMRSRDDQIAIFIQHGCTPAGAATYYAKIRREG